MQNKKNKPEVERPMPPVQEAVKVKVYRHVPNKNLLQVQVPNGDGGTMKVGLMRVRDSHYYRAGEMIPARLGDHDVWEPLKTRFRPNIGGLV